MEKGRLLGRPFFICPQVRLWPVGWRAPALCPSRLCARPGFVPVPAFRTGCCGAVAGARPGFRFQLVTVPSWARSRPFARVVPGAFPGVVLKAVSGCSVLSLPKAFPLPHPGRRVPPAGRYRIRVPVSTPRRKVFPHRGTPPAGGGAGATACPCRCVRVRLP